MEREGIRVIRLCLCDKIHLELRAYIEFEKKNKAAGLADGEAKR